MCTNYTKRSVMKLNKATLTINYEFTSSFNVGDYIIVQIRPKRFLPGTVKKLHARNARHFKILNKLNDNTYVIDLSKDFGISYTFNVENLVDNKDPDLDLILVCRFVLYA